MFQKSVFFRVVDDDESCFAVELLADVFGGRKVCEILAEVVATVASKDPRLIRT
jgi:hypothetical protein